jgi:pilus assembly protein CpaB
MQKYQKLLIMLSFLFALLTTFIGYKIFVSLTTVEDDSAAQYMNVPIAATDLPSITQIDQSHITYVKIPIELVKHLALITDESEIVGKVLLSPIDQNSFFTKSDLLDEENDIPFHLPDEYRAITIDITAVSSVGGYLQEGMFIDILWTYDKDGVLNTAIPFENVKILAVGSAKISGNLSLTDNSSAKTITLLMSPLDAQRLTHMTSTGAIKLMLRSSPIVEEENLPPTNIDNVLVK